MSLINFSHLITYSNKEIATRSDCASGAFTRKKDVLPFGQDAASRHGVNTALSLTYPDQLNLTQEDQKKASRNALEAKEWAKLTVLRIRERKA